MTHNTANRYLLPFIRQDLAEKMVFLSGPRQVGKTTLALTLVNGDETHPAYFNWDDDDDRDRMIAKEFPVGQKTLIFDEIHKYRRWRNWLKGLYDKTKSSRRYLVTGSARLDLYRRGGDALTGRYHFYNLHPLSLAEIKGHNARENTAALLKFGGFPEPFYKHSERHHKRWQRERMKQVLRDDLHDLERVEEVTLIERLAQRLPALIGSPLSVNGLREDLQVAHRTVQKWLDILERLYVVFRIPPLGGPRIRAVKKEMKAYLWDWSEVPDPGARFENFVACQLLKYCHFIEDTQGDRMELRYIRDTDKREVDFVVLKEGQPLFAVDCQLGDSNINPAIPYFASRLPIPQFDLVHMSTKDYEHGQLPLRVAPFHVWAKEREMP